MGRLRVRMLGAPVVALLLFGAAAGTQPFEEPHEPHTPTLIYYLTGCTAAEDVEALRTAVAKEPSASVVEINTTRSYVRVKFDSHVIGYHQMAQALADAGASLKKKYDPTLLFMVPDYASHTKEVDAIFAGKKLNTRVHVTAVDREKGLFAVHFLPLKVNSADKLVQGFNGGHLHHPISDPDPRGLNLPSSYGSNDDPAVYPPTAAGAGTRPE